MDPLVAVICGPGKAWSRILRSALEILAAHGPRCRLGESNGTHAEAPSGIGADWLMAQNSGFARKDIGPLVGHYTFLDRPAHGVPEGLEVLFVDPPGVDRDAVHRQTAGLVLSALVRA